MDKNTNKFQIIMITAKHHLTNFCKKEFQVTSGEPEKVDLDIPSLQNLMYKKAIIPD